MLFATNRIPRESAKTVVGRRISFELQNTSAAPDMYFCERHNVNEYTEIGSLEFFQRLKNLDSDTQILLYIHGFNNTDEKNIFPTAIDLQEILNNLGGKNLAYVVPLIWPCDDDSITQLLEDYWDDQRAADWSGNAFARMLGKFDTWRKSDANQNDPCMKRINVLAHSMGNRVLRNALSSWVHNDLQGQMPQIFRNIFMVAADVVNDTLEPEKDGKYIPHSARNVVVYYANDDLAMSASKIANLKNKIVSRRLGMTGPANLENTPKNVYEVDCDDFNSRFDDPIGHSYFTKDSNGLISPVIKHIIETIKTGRVDQRSFRLDLNYP